MSITASDGTYEASITITVDVQILNDNPPVITLARSTAVFVENASSSFPLAIGAIFQPDITDADNNAVFLMESASVTLFDAVDGSLEGIEVPQATRDGLATLNILVEG